MAEIRIEMILASRMLIWTSEIKYGRKKVCSIMQTQSFPCLDELQQWYWTTLPWKASAYKRLSMFSYVRNIPACCGRETMGRPVLSPLHLSLWPLWRFCERTWKFLGSELEEGGKIKRNKDRSQRNKSILGKKLINLGWGRSPCEAMLWCSCCSEHDTLFGSSP